MNTFNLRIYLESLFQRILTHEACTGLSPDPPRTHHSRHRQTHHWDSSTQPSVYTHDFWSGGKCCHYQARTPCLVSQNLPYNLPSWVEIYTSIFPPLKYLQNKFERKLETSVLLVVPFFLRRLVKIIIIYIIMFKVFVIV